MASSAKTVVLITGGKMNGLCHAPPTLANDTPANSGIGFELAAQLLAKGTYHVLLGARSASKGATALADLQSRNYPGTAELHQLDVTDDTTINNTATAVEKTHGKLDILVNNAAVAVPTGTDREQLNAAFDTNATGPYVLTKALLPLLQKSSAARVINVSSGISSIARKLDTSSPFHKVSGVQYRASKTALNMVTAVQYVEFAEFGIKVHLYDPGFTVSNLGPHNSVEHGARTADKSVVSLVDLLEGRRDADLNGELVHLHNTGRWPW
jgi:NAD(P)-dependent dehydrogenase (short-subunit alcohol dehydrogenase family)